MARPAGRTEFRAGVGWLKRDSIPRTEWFLLACVCAFFYFYGLGFFGLIGADEPRYAQVAREMLARHDWITPALNGKAWLEKPVLYYWQAMLAYSIFGVSDWAARLPGAVDASGLVLAVYLFLQRFRKGSELDGAMMTASAAAIVGFARAASTDMPLAAMFSVAMLAWYSWYATGSRKYLAVFYIFIGLGTLAKGPVAPFLAALVIAVFALIRREFPVIRHTLWLPGILLFCAVTLPWYVAVQIKNPQFFREFILQHNLARFGTNLYHHRQPAWYYVPVLLLGLVPWVVFVIAALVDSVRAWFRERTSSDAESSWDVFLVIWLIAPVVFFSLSQSKLPGYILPAIPAGTLLLAGYVRRKTLSSQGPGTFVVAMHALIASLPIVPALMIQYLLWQHRLPWNKATFVSSIIALVLALGIAFSIRRPIALAGLRIVTLVPAVLVVGIVLRLGASGLDQNLSARPVANELAQLNNNRLPLAVFQVKRELEYGLAFYRNQAVERYEFGQIPAEEHLVIAPAGSQVEVAKQIPGRKVSYLGGFPAQHLEYFWVSARP